MKKKGTTPRKSRSTRSAPAQRQSASYGSLALILGLALVALLACLFGVAAVSRLVTSKTTEAPAATETSDQPAQLQACRAINDYQLQDLPELSVEPGGFLHVEWYAKDGDPERESVLPSGRYLIKTPLRGHVWEYSPSCTPEQVLDQVAGQIERRVDVGANNAGFAPWQEWLVGKGLIEIVKMTNTSVIPTVLNPTK